MSSAAAPQPGFKVSTVMLRVSDMARSIEFYRDLVGLPLRFSNAEFAAFDCDGVMLFLNRPEKIPPGEGGGLASLTEVVLEAPDVLSAYENLKARGVPFRIAPRPVTSDGTRDLHAADFRDPDGHVLSLTGWVLRDKG